MSKEGFKKSYKIFFGFVKFSIVSFDISSYFEASRDVKNFVNSSEKNPFSVCWYYDLTLKFMYSLDINHKIIIHEMLSCGLT